MKKFQIKTYGDPSLARAIQRKLESLGYRTGFIAASSDHYYNLGGAKTVYCTTYEGRDMVGGDFGNFITIDELFTMQPEAKETIKIGTQTYDKADFEAATKHLTPIK